MTEADAPWVPLRSVSPPPHPCALAPSAFEPVPTIPECECSLFRPNRPAIDQAQALAGPGGRSVSGLGRVRGVSGKRQTSLACRTLRAVRAGPHRALGARSSCSGHNQARGARISSDFAMIDRAALAVAACALLALSAASAAPRELQGGAVDVPLGGMEPGWTFFAYRFYNSPRSRRFEEIPETRTTGTVFDPTFFVRRNEPPAVYKLGDGVKDYIHIEWSGLLRITRPGRYRFELGSDDGSELWIDGREVSPAGEMARREGGFRVGEPIQGLARAPPEQSASGNGEPFPSIRRSSTTTGGMVTGRGTLPSPSRPGSTRSGRSPGSGGASTRSSSTSGGTPRTTTTTTSSLTTCRSTGRTFSTLSPSATRCCLRRRGGARACRPSLRLARFFRGPRTQSRW